MFSPLISSMSFVTLLINQCSFLCSLVSSCSFSWLCIASKPPEYHVQGAFLL
ncbi:hypothetical protein DJ66_0325 [Candidatus Liberibacter solanacearum]|uniref:Uncharacterized protein n=1 Tax=Candidatus Liberibacter solanacearum TaxID=556287 RepID=A0A0F4VJB4_9HYPH|nr:hypothetical protein DJ66_0325 [Candidatus Liberibacter solanacearum]